jgi:hypothetical protein
VIGAAIAGGVLALAIPVGIGVAAMSSFADGLSLTTPSDEGRAGGDRPAERGEVEVVVPDLDDLEGTDAELAGILVDIDRAEQQMLVTQEEVAAILAEAALGGAEAPAGDLAERLADAAGEGQRELQEIRQDLTAASLGDAEVREIRDVYLAHLDAWVRYFVAAEEEPGLLAGGGGDEAFLLAINTTADRFARTIRQDLPDGLDERVEEFAGQIVERGFPQGEAGDSTV